MGRARIDEVDYYQFMKRLRAAGESDGRIDPSDKERWKAYVQKRSTKSIATGTCVRCKKRAHKGEQMCLKHGTRTKAYMSKYKKIDRATCIRKGICTINGCKKRARNGRRMCVTCTNRDRDYQRKRYAASKD